jgi:molecular chaperone DnaK
MALKDGATVELSLAKPGENTFKVFVFDSKGGPVALKEDKIVIASTAASIDAIPASHSIGVEARDKAGGASGPGLPGPRRRSVAQEGQKRSSRLRSP